MIAPGRRGGKGKLKIENENRKLQIESEHQKKTLNPKCFNLQSLLQNPPTGRLRWPSVRRARCIDGPMVLDAPRQGCNVSHQHCQLRQYGAPLTGCGATTPTSSIHIYLLTEVQQVYSQNVQTFSLQPAAWRILQEALQLQFSFFFNFQFPSRHGVLA